MSTIRLFSTTAAYLKASNAAKVMHKIMQGSTKRKTWYSPASNEVPELFGQSSTGNRKVASRRVKVLNAVFHERITELVSSTEVDPTLQDYGFLITRVKLENDGSALHVFWSADSKVTELSGKLPQLSKKLRHMLTQLQVCGHVPYINFIRDKTLYRAVDVEDLLSKADYGPDFIPSGHKPQMDEIHLDSEVVDLTMSTNVLGLDRAEIMNQISRAMNSEQRKSNEPRHTELVESQQKVDFKKFLKERAGTNFKPKRLREELPTLRPVETSPDEDFHWEGRDFIEEDDVEDDVQNSSRKNL